MLQEAPIIEKGGEAAANVTLEAGAGAKGCNAQTELLEPNAELLEPANGPPIKSETKSRRSYKV